MLRVEIIVTVQIDETWREWLGGLEMHYTGPNLTVLSGELDDQAAIYGVISRLRDLGIPLASVSIHAVEARKG